MKWGAFGLKHFGVGGFGGVASEGVGVWGFSARIGGLEGEVLGFRCFLG